MKRERKRWGVIGSGGECVGSGGEGKKAVGSDRKRWAVIGSGGE